MDLRCKRVVVMGLGRFGGGVGVARFLVERGAQVLVTDLAPAESLTQSVARLAGLAVQFRLGGHEEADFRQADLIVVNPAVDPRNNRYLQAAAAAGVETTSEMRLLVQHLPARGRVIGVTGTAGKSTTTAMIGHVLRKADRTVWVGGNLGGSLLGDLGRIGPDDWVVLELSSFMLEGLQPDHWSPHIAVLTNVAPNHLDRHDTLEAYARAKQVILEYQRPGDACVLGPDLPRPWIHPRVTNVVWMETLSNLSGRPAPKLLIPGAHNRLNAQMAIEACALAGVERHAAAEALGDFRGLPHRLCLVGERGGVRYFDDSKATTPQASLLALGSFPPGVVHLIAGGYDKHADLSPLAQEAAQRARAVYTIGATGPALARAARGQGSARIEECGTLGQAMRRITQAARPGEVVLLSPGCASWDQFENYEQRGQAFAAAIG